MADSLSGLHNQLKAQFGQIGKIKENLAGVSNLLDGLTKLGDVVTEDDVIEAAGKITGKGLLSANAMAGILAEMPANGGGQALANWIGQHVQEIAQQQQQVEQIHEAVGHKMAVSAHHVMGEALAGQGASMSGETGNSLGAMPMQGNA